MLDRYSFHTNSLVKTLAPLINCIIDDALLETMPDIDQPLLLFIDIKNLIDPLLHFCAWLHKPEMVTMVTH